MTIGGTLPEIVASVGAWVPGLQQGWDVDSGSETDWLSQWGVVVESVAE